MIKLVIGFIIPPGKGSNNHAFKDLEYSLNWIKKNTKLKLFYVKSQLSSSFKPFVRYTPKQKPPIAKKFKTKLGSTRSIVLKTPQSIHKLIIIHPAICLFINNPLKRY